MLVVVIWEEGGVFYLWIFFVIYCCYYCFCIIYYYFNEIDVKILNLVIEYIKMKFIDKFYFFNMEYRCIFKAGASFIYLLFMWKIFVEYFFNIMNGVRFWRWKVEKDFDFVLRKFGSGIGR